MSELNRDGQRYNKKYLQKQLLIVAISSVGVYVGFKYFLPLFLPFMFAFLIAKFLRPIVKLLKYRFHIPVIIGSIFCIAITFGILGCALGYLWFILTKEVQSFLSQLPSYTDAAFRSLDSICVKCDGILQLSPGSSNRYLQENIENIWTMVDDVIMSVISERTYMVFIGFFAVVSVLVVIVIAIINIILDYDEIKEIYINSELYRCISPVTSKLGHVGYAYVKTQATIMSINAVILIAGFYFMKSPYAWLAGIGIAIADALPAIGSGLFLFPIAIIKLINGNYAAALIVVALYGICEFVRSLVEPRMLGGRIGLKPIYTLMAMFIGFQIFGILGFLMGPLALVIIKTILEVNGCLKQKE